MAVPTEMSISMSVAIAAHASSSIVTNSVPDLQARVLSPHPGPFAIVAASNEMTVSGAMRGRLNFRSPD